MVSSLFSSSFSSFFILALIIHARNIYLFKMAYLVTALVVASLLILAEGCLKLLPSGEDICTDRALCQTFAPCDLVKCGKEDAPVCSAIQLKTGYSCIKRYRNECFYRQARCKNQDIKEIPCPAISAECPSVPADKGLVHCSKRK